MKMMLILLLLGFQMNSASASSKQAKLSTDIRFDNMTVRGRYQSAGGAIATVEDEKVIEDLLVVRKHFKDRVRNSLRND